MMKFKDKPNYSRLRKMLEDLYMHAMQSGFDKIHEKYVAEEMR